MKILVGDLHRGPGVGLPIPDEDTREREKRKAIARMQRRIATMPQPPRSSTSTRIPEAITSQQNYAEAPPERVRLRRRSARSNALVIPASWPTDETSAGRVTSPSTSR